MPRELLDYIAELNLKTQFKCMIRLTKNHFQTKSTFTIKNLLGLIKFLIKSNLVRRRSFKILED